ncbi:uncharacterized protein TrAtP1_001829 [Trichoderma atroviride]|uniref:uncharacterized protein n=1 Tax=Hypocrea atroviridis TaxID=63577 RepID=UPI003317EC5B|nr:hypothetical protein TrAtP1_001829 [Trichoderma atroviride]
MTVAPAKIPRTGTSGYRNGKLGTHHQQDLASCRFLPLIANHRCRSPIPICASPPVASTSSSANSRPKQKD